MQNITIEEINERIINEPDIFISQCEENYHKSLEAVAEKINFAHGRKLVMLAGPSSSGKTTTASFLKKLINDNGRNAVTVSLDDFYLDQTHAPKFPDGRPDFETVHALDIPKITKCLTSLLEDGRAYFPIFDFNVRKPSDETKLLEIGENDAVIVEGLHALNPLITDPLEEEDMLKLYVSVSSRVFDGENVVFSKRDIRFLRRMIRDYKFRNSPVDFTFYLWKGVRTGEDKYLFPFSSRADMKIDSIHPYELCVYKKLGEELLSHIEKDSVYYSRACELRQKLSLMRSLDTDDVPEDSLLHEFIG
ncbi:MAG: uridine kinase [Acutalibacteraceae bacterium]